MLELMNYNISGKHLFHSITLTQEQAEAAVDKASFRELLISPYYETDLTNFDKTEATFAVKDNMPSIRYGSFYLKNRSHFDPFVVYKNTPVPKKIRLAGYYNQEASKLCYFIFITQNPITGELFYTYVFNDSSKVTTVISHEGIKVDNWTKQIYTQKRTDTFDVEYDFTDLPNYKIFMAGLKKVNIGIVSAATGYSTDGSSSSTYPLYLKGFSIDF